MVGGGWIVADGQKRKRWKISKGLFKVSFERALAALEY
jgi:hypothetical protein